MVEQHVPMPRNDLATNYPEVCMHRLKKVHKMNAKRGDRA